MSTLSLLQPTHPSRTSLMYTLPVRQLRDILEHNIPGVTLTSLEELRSTRLPRLYHLNLSDGKQLLLSFAPSLIVRLLRHEQTLLLSEATLIHYLSSLNMPDIIDFPSTLSTTALQELHGIKLSKLLPVMIRHSSNLREMGYPYTLFESGVGEPLANLSIYLSRPEQRLIDKQIGIFVRALAMVVSPSGTFGTVSRLCTDPSTPAPSSSTTRNRGFPDWNGAFMSLVEAILRDGEDMSVLLPYDTIRKHLGRLSLRISAVKTPRLVVMDAGESSNVLIQRHTEQATPLATDGPRVTGLRDWSQGIFGDPLLTSSFENPTEGFLEGWRLNGVDDIIEDEEGTATRLLLYRCYRAVVNIVTEYYRPQPDSSRRELDGRRKLTNVLAELEKVDIGPSNFTKRARSAPDSGIMEAAKRQRLDMPRT